MSSYTGACVQEEGDLRQNAGNSSISKGGKETSSKTSEREPPEEAGERSAPCGRKSQEAEQSVVKWPREVELKKERLIRVPGILQLKEANWRPPGAVSMSGARRWWAEE